MPRYNTVDDYIAGLEGWSSETALAIREIVTNSAPNATESIKWSQPVWEQNGPFAYIKAFKNHINFGFWRGADLPDPNNLLEGAGDKMRHIKITSVDQIDTSAFTALIKSAVELNATKGDPTKSATK